MLFPCRFVDQTWRDSLSGAQKFSLEHTLKNSDDLPARDIRTPQMHVSLVRRAKNTVRLLLAGRVRSFDAVRSFVEGKKGLEIGGPSTAFQRWFKPLPIYHRVGSLDNCDISRVTTWTTHADTYRFSPRKQPGKNIFVDASNLSCLADQSYDFVLSSHNLEHFANPVKALYEWKRVTRPGGGLILLLPHHLRTFDHRRLPTTVDHMFEDFRQATPEDDLFHLPEILEKHDFSLDPGTTSVDEFRRRSLDNFHNRCLHHHVFNESNSRELLVRSGLEVLAVERALPNHIFLLARVP
jgi:SAM-dependent methyltransferase